MKVGVDKQLVCKARVAKEAHEKGCAGRQACSMPMREVSTQPGPYCPPMRARQCHVRHFRQFLVVLSIVFFLYIYIFLVKGS